MNRKISIIIIIIFGQTSLFGQGFNGFDKANLTPVTNTDGDWGLKIIVLNVGQADAIVPDFPHFVALPRDFRIPEFKRSGAEIQRNKTFHDAKLWCRYRTPKTMLSSKLRQGKL